MIEDRGAFGDRERPKAADGTPPVDGRRFSRRSVLATLATAAAGLALGVGCRDSAPGGSPQASSSAKRPTPRRSSEAGAGSKCLSGAELGSDASADEWVGNSETQTLHHTGACRDHLPAPARRVAFGEGTTSYCVHRGKRVTIHETVAEQHLQNGEYEAAINSLRLAIAASPLSFHLYDKLIRIHGRLRQYDAIQSLLTDAQQFVSRQPRVSGATGFANAQLRRYDRASSEFAMRLERTKRRAQARRA
jgi:hypothetical protein